MVVYCHHNTFSTRHFSPPCDFAHTFGIGVGGIKSKYQTLTSGYDPLRPLQSSRRDTHIALVYHAAALTAVVGRLLLIYQFRKPPEAPTQR